MLVNCFSTGKRIETKPKPFFFLLDFNIAKLIKSHCETTKINYLVTIFYNFNYFLPRTTAISLPLLDIAAIANVDVSRILIDQGSSCDIMYMELYSPNSESK
jgi:hypothetical protein